MHHPTRIELAAIWRNSHLNLRLRQLKLKLRLTCIAICFLRESPILQGLLAPLCNDWFVHLFIYLFIHVDVYRKRHRCILVRV